MLQGNLRKMATELTQPVTYTLRLIDGDQEHNATMNDYLGKQIRLEFQGQINCVHCGRKSKKSFNQGYCYPCFTRLAQCDSCIVSPEKCHYDQGTCREPEWGEQNCMIEHFVYLANSTGVKVGITRHTQIPTRWMDQGAVSALPIFKVSSRLQSGMVETVFKQHVADKTSWQAMLKGVSADIDLREKREQLMAAAADDIAALKTQYGDDAIEVIDDAEQVEIRYPVLEFPSKVKSFNFDKQPLVEGTLMGIKGQYLMLDSGVINLRKFGGYLVEFSA